MVIVSARITALPKTFSDPMPEVYVTMEDGNEHLLFEYYPDEISFTSKEFVGLTLTQAIILKRKKDIDFLKS
jgi:hypothetical protein